MCILCSSRKTCSSSSTLYLPSHRVRLFFEQFAFINYRTSVTQLILLIFYMQCMVTNVCVHTAQHIVFTAGLHTLAWMSIPRASIAAPAQHRVNGVAQKAFAISSHLHANVILLLNYYFIWFMWLLLTYTRFRFRFLPLSFSTPFFSFRSSCHQIRMQIVQNHRIYSSIHVAWMREIFLYLSKRIPNWHWLASAKVAIQSHSSAGRCW